MNKLDIKIQYFWPFKKFQLANDKYLTGGCGRWLIFFICFSFFASSCSTSKNISYFQDLNDTLKLYSQIIQETYEVQIQPDDIIQIIVNSMNLDETAVFNLGNTAPDMSSIAIITSLDKPLSVVNNNSFKINSIDNFIQFI